MGITKPSSEQHSVPSTGRDWRHNMTVKIDENDKNLCKRKYENTFVQESKTSKEPSPKLKRKKLTSVGTDPEPASTPSFPSLLLGGAPFSVPATVCYEGEGILVVQLKWRGKTFFGTLLSQDKCDRNFKISEKFPILDKTLENEVKQESDTKDNEIEESETSLIDKSSNNSLEDSVVTRRSENKREVNKENSTDCFDFDNEDILDKESSLKVGSKKPKKQFTKGFKCDLCDKKYTWYTGLSNHKRFVHNNKTKE